MHKPLEAIRVVEVAEYISGPYCGLLLAGLGADVIKIEEPDEGDISRTNGPFAGGVPDRDKSGLFCYLNRGKRGVTLSLRRNRGREVLLRLLQRSDVLIDGLSPRQADELELDFEHLNKINPRLIVASITAFGHTGPYRDYKAYDINASAIGGMSLIIGSPDREPITPPFGLGHYQTGVIAANAVLFALMVQSKRGVGQHLDISEAESWAIFHTGNVVSAFIYGGRKRSRTGHRTPGPYPYTILPCKDGYISMIALRGSEWKRFLEIVGEGRMPEWYTSDERFQDRLRAGMQYADELDRLLSPWLMAHTKEEIFARCTEAHVPFAPVRTIGEVVNCEHLNARGYFVPMRVAGQQEVRSPGAPVRFQRSAMETRTPAPCLGEHNSVIYCDELGYSAEEVAELRRMRII